MTLSADTLLGRNNLIKLLLISLGIALNYTLYQQRLADLEGLVSTTIYVGLFAFALSAILATALLRSTLARLLWGLLFLLAGTAHDANFKVMGAFIAYDTFLLMYESLGFASAAIEQYGGVILASLPANLLIFLGVLVSPTRSTGRPHPVARLLPLYPIGVLVALVAMLYIRGGNGSNGLPSPIIIPSLGGLFAFDVLNREHYLRQPVSIPVQPAEEQAFQDIVYVIDESIRADYLDINHGNGAGSGLQTPPGNVTARNYGYAASATNCSVGTNMVLRFGGTREKYRLHIDAMPSIWQYARAAGLQTVYLDAQSEDQFYNGMDDEEISHIDRIIQYKDTLPRDRDVTAAEDIARLINDDRRQLIVINKLGAHFPIHDKFPDAYGHYRPMLSRGTTDASKAITRTIFGADSIDWEKYKNSYKNTILWSVGVFFERIFSQADLSRTLLIYTSDHGQNFHERGEGGQHTHCSRAGNPSLEEGLVPLVALIGNDTAWAERFAADTSAPHARSHYQIFPTLLEFMGYDRNAVHNTYGDTLLDEPADPMTFNTKFEARLGQKPTWVRLDLDKLVFPPENP